MRLIKTSLLIAAVATTTLVATTVTAQNYGSMAKKAAGLEKKNIVETAAVNGKFTTLLTAAKAAGLAETLSTGGPFTVFAPTDEAFKKLPEGTVESLLANPEKLKEILLYHVVDGNVKAADVVNLRSAATLQGGSVTVASADGKVKINDATVTKTDIECSNGVIHVIDTVLLPPAAAPAAGEKSIVAIASENASFGTLTKALKAAGLTETLEGEGPFTVFAPTDEAFKKLPPATLATLLTPAGKDQLKTILLSHVVAGEVRAADAAKLTSATTVSGKVIPVVAKDGTVTIGGAKVVTADIDAKNGVIHVIDTVIVPE